MRSGEDLSANSEAWLTFHGPSLPQKEVRKNPTHLISHSTPSYLTPHLLPKQASWTEKKCDSHLEWKVRCLYIGSALPEGTGIWLPWPWGLRSSCGPPVISLCWSWSTPKTHTTTARHWRKQVWARRMWAPLGSDSIVTSPQQRVSKLLHFYGLKWKGMNDPWIEIQSTQPRKRGLCTQA